MGKAVTIGLVVLLVLSVFGNIVLFQTADDEITKLENQLSSLNETYKGVNVGKEYITVTVDYYDDKPVVVREILYSGREIEIEPGHIRYTCFNYVVKDTRLTIEAKKIGSTPVRFYLFDYQRYQNNEPHAIIFGGDFAVENETYHLNRLSAMELGRTYCVGFSVPERVYTSTGWQDVATNGKVWVKAVVEAYVDIYPEEIMKKK